MKSFFFILAVSFLSPLCCCCQIFRDNDMDKARSLERVHYYHEGVLLGCNFDVECKGLNVKFAKIYYDKQKNKLFLSGNVFWGTENRPMPGVIIFSAQTRDSTLINLKQIDSTYKQKGLKNFPYAMGSFSGSFEVMKGRKLYILHPSFLLIEYNIDKLLDRRFK